MSLPLYKRLVRASHKTSTKSVQLHSFWRRHTRAPAHTVFIAATPKSASTFLTHLLHELTGYIPHSLTEDVRQEQNLYLPKLIDGHGMNTVSHLHTMPTPRNMKLMKQFSIKPIILTRNIPDSIVSHQEFKTTEPDDYWFADYKTFDKTKQLNFTIDNIAPIFMQFIAGWHKQAPDALWLTYEDVTQDTKNTLQKIRDYYSLSYSDDHIDTVIKNNIKPKNVRLNKGVSGRGDTLTQEQFKRLLSFAQYYPDAPIDMRCKHLPR